MVMENIHILMDQLMRGNMKMMLGKVKENSIILVELSTKVNGKTI